MKLTLGQKQVNTNKVEQIALGTKYLQLKFHNLQSRIYWHSGCFTKIFEIEQIYNFFQLLSIYYDNVYSYRRQRPQQRETYKHHIRSFVYLLQGQHLQKAELVPTACVLRHTNVIFVLFKSSQNMIERCTNNKKMKNKKYRKLKIFPSSSNIV